LIVTTNVSDQKNSDSTPRMFSVLGVTPWGAVTHSLSAYSGEVPMSP
jgi:hypothetical protein